MNPNFPDFSLPAIVIVDDCEDDIFLLRHRLRAGGITNPVVTFNSPPEAVSYLTSASVRGQHPSLLFTDIKIPGHDSFDFIAWIRAEPQWDDMRVAVISSSNQPADLERAVALRVDGYVVKFPPPDLLAEFVCHGPWFSFPRRAVELSA